MKGGAIPKVYTDEEILALMSVTLNTIPNLRRNSALHAFEISMLKVESMHLMVDGVRDVFNDAAGILSGGSVAGGVLTCNEFITAAGTPTAESGTAANGVDDDEGTYWSSGVNAVPTWWEIDLGESLNISKVKLIKLMDNSGLDGSFNYDLSYWNGSSWVVLIDDYLADTSGSNQSTYEHDFVVTTNKIRFDCAAPTYRAGFYELQIAVAVPHVTSVNATAEAQPTNIHAVILADDAAITLNTDLKFYASVDDGATWEQITLTDSGDYSATEKILTGSVAVAGTGTTIKYKIECTDATFEFYAVGLLWD